MRGEIIAMADDEQAARAYFERHRRAIEVELERAVDYVLLTEVLVGIFAAEVVGCTRRVGSPTWEPTGL